MKNMKNMIIGYLLLTSSVLLVSCTKNEIATNTKEGNVKKETSLKSVNAHDITLTGKLIWHSYSDYSFDGVKSWMVNFDTKKKYNITKWRCRGAMNYHFNQDGSEVVFMSDDRYASGDEWDIWVASVSSTGLSNFTKITKTNGTRDEDPKFSADGTKIIFKQNLTKIKTIKRSAFSVNGNNQTPKQTTVLSKSTEIGMPFFIGNSNSNFLYSNGDGNSSSIRKKVGNRTYNVYNQTGYQEYYPVSVDGSKFYYTKGVAGSSPDQLFIGQVSGSNPVGVAFNTSAYEVADACDLNWNWVTYSTTRPGGSGGYDIWLGNVYTGETFNLNDWKSGSNQSNNDLGSTFYGTIY